MSEGVLVSRFVDGFIGGPYIFYFSSGKTQLVSFDQSNNSYDIYGKTDSSVLEEKRSFKMLILSLGLGVLHCL